MKSVFYWSPCLTKVGTVKSTLNSAIALSKYSKNKYIVKMINSCGEWDEYKSELEKNNIEIINFQHKYFKYLPKNGFFKSRISYLIIILFSFFPLLKLLKKEKPEFIIIHLITSLPILLNNLFDFNTKFILRISGFPKLTFFRKYLWKISSKNIFKITCPTKDLLSNLIEQKIFTKEKLFYLQDAIIRIKDYRSNNISDINLENKIITKNNFFLSVGRLTKQKNYNYLISEFKCHLNNHKNDILLVIGEGEERKKIEKLIKSNNLTRNIFLLGRINNVYPYMKKARALILSSLWEEVGFVIVEAAFSNLFVVSSNCPNGPVEFLEQGRAGYLFESNKKDALCLKLSDFNQMEKNLKEFKIKAKKNSSNFTLFRHYMNLKKILSNEIKL
jgi:glycosyltransferase involved in cell wall biosynthesis